MKRILFIPEIAGIRLWLSAIMKITGALAALVLAACQLESDLTISNAEYTDKNTFTVYYAGNPEGSVSFNAEGKDRHYTIKRYTSISILATRVTCELNGDFISGDHIIVTSDDMSGSAEFDVPDYRE
jgi:hypothetical protein